MIAMSHCDEGSTDCSSETSSDDESDGVMEARWLGLTVASLFLLILLIWLIRTLSSPTKRQELLHKLKHCCSFKGYNNSPHLRYTPGATSATLGQILSSKGDFSPRHSETNGVIYYTPTLPPLAGQKTASSTLSTQHQSPGFGVYHSDEKPEKDTDTADESGGANGANLCENRPRPARSLRKCRSTLTMLNINLTPIQEVDDSAGADSPKRLRVHQCARQERLHSSPRGSRSYPARLASLASDSEEDDIAEAEISDLQPNNIDNKDKHQVTLNISVDSTRNGNVNLAATCICLENGHD